VASLGHLDDQARTLVGVTHTAEGSTEHRAVQFVAALVAQCVG
jgi:hypothetical protein